tara:strand:- start:5969 stop:7678 length:1710 start_codon:yes stop_codon:yes gene_type:complete
MAYFTNEKYDKYKNPAHTQPKEDGAATAYNPTDRTQLNPYLDVDPNQLESMYNQELNALGSPIDNTRVAPFKEIGADGKFVKYQGGDESDYGDSFWSNKLEEGKAEGAQSFKKGGALKPYHEGGEMQHSGYMGGHEEGDHNEDGEYKPFVEKDGIKDMFTDDEGTYDREGHVEWLLNFGPGSEKHKEEEEKKRLENVTNLSFLPPNLEEKHPDVYKKLMGMDMDTKSKMTDYFSNTVDSARENVKGVASGLSWFSELDVEPVKDILGVAKIEKGEFRDVVQGYAEAKAKKAGEDFGFMNRTALTGAMALKGLKRGGELPKKVEGGGLTENQETAINWANLATTAVNVGTELNEGSSIFNKKGNAYSENSLKDTRKAAVKERAKKGASIGGTTGAAIGSVIPVIGTAVGGAIGTAVGAIAGTVSGWFGGKKQYEKDEKAVLKRETEENVNMIGLGNQMSETIAQKKSLDNTKDYLETTLASGPYGSHKRGGMVYGPRHEEGGVMAVKNGKPIAEVEGDEYIINNDIIKDKKESKERFKVEGTPAQIASALNSYKGYGDNTNPGGNIYKIG